MKKQLMLVLASLLLGGSSVPEKFPNTISKADKVYGLSKIWQEVNYNFVYINSIDRPAWNEYYRYLITEVQNTENDYEYYRLLERFCARLNDGHTDVRYPQKIREALYTLSFGNYSFYVEPIEGKAIITHINWSKKEEIPVGTEILAVNGRSTVDYIEDEVLPYICASTDYVREEMAVFQLLRAPIGTKFKLDLRKPDGELITLDLKHQAAPEEDFYPPWEERDLFEFKWLGGGMAYIALNSFMDARLNEQFLTVLPELRKAKSLIIDLRKNGGGRSNIAMEVLQYLTYDDELHHAAYQSRMHIPYFKSSGVNFQAQDTLIPNGEAKDWRVKTFLSYHDNYWYKEASISTSIKLPPQERIVIPTAILVGHGTASTSEDFLIAAENQDHMIRIGQESNGSTGQPIHFDLPGGGSFRVCTKKDTYPDGRLFVGIGIQPHIRVEPTLQDFLNQRDGVLEAAIDYLNQL